MSPFMKGALGFLGCAGICAIFYQIGKAAGREETLREVEIEERIATAERKAVKTELTDGNQVLGVVEVPQESENPPVAEKVRKKHAIKDKIFGGFRAAKDLLKNLGDKQLIVTVENEDILARITPK